MRIRTTRQRSVRASRVRPRVYLDYAAATPISREVSAAMAPYLREEFGNPSALHKEGRAARDANEASRAAHALSVGIRATEVIFTSGGTESNNLGIAGFLEALLRTRKPEECEVLTTPIEHPSVYGVLAVYAQRGVSVRELPVTEEGLVRKSSIAAALSSRTVLVVCAYANSEIGVVQDVKMISRQVRLWRARQKSAFPIMHLDASQAPLYLPCAFDSLGVDMMTLDAGKCYGPKGAGVLAKRITVPWESLSHGGDQEFGMRPGTENTAAIVGCAMALTSAQRQWERRARCVGELREYGMQLLCARIPGVVVNGSRDHRIANNINISIPGIDGEYAAVFLDTHGFAVSTKSACSGLSGSGSKVVYALGGDDARALSTVRISLDEHVTKRNIQDLVRVLKDHVAMVKGKLT